MKKINFSLIIIILFTSNIIIAQSVAINSTGAAPTSDAMLEVVQTGTSETAYFKSSNEDGYGLHIRTVDNGNDKYALKVDTDNGEIAGLTVTNAGNAPVGSGLFILLGLGAVYGEKNVWDLHKEELEE